MKYKILGVIILLAAIAACATKPIDVVDNTPLNPTAVIEHQVISNGIKGFFPFESTDRHFVRANLRRDDSTFKGTGTFSGYLIGKHSGTEITRLDRKLKWSLNTDKEEYTECPLTGCIKPSKQHQPERQNEAKPPEAQHESGCTMHIANTSFTVKSTGQKKSINGFDTDEYKVAWIVNLADKEARKTTSTLDIDVWTTPMTASMRDALGVEESFSRAYSGTVTETAKKQILPAEAAKLISAYLASTLKPGDLNAFLDAGKQLEKIKGYPISTHLAWNMDGNACAPKDSGNTENKPSTSGGTGSTVSNVAENVAQSKHDSSSTSSSVGSLVSGLAGIFAQKKSEEMAKEAEKEPMLSFTFEVKTLRIEPQHDSEFTVPKNYRLVSQL
jgi:hypothetical protein